MELNEFFDPNTALALESKTVRPTTNDLIKIVQERAPEVFELWLYGDRAKGVAHRGAPWAFLAVVPDNVDAGRAAELLQILRGLNDVIPGISMEFYLCRDRQRHNDISPLHAAVHGEGKKLWTDHAKKHLTA